MAEQDQNPTEKPAYQRLGDELRESMTKWARTGQVTPVQTAELLTDGLAQVMAMSVPAGRLEQALTAADQLLRHKVYHHAQQLAHMRAGAGMEPPPPPGKAN